MKDKNKYLSVIYGLGLALALTVGVSYVKAQWSAPTEAPPGGNVPAPINVSSLLQIKEGALGVGALDVDGDAFFNGDIFIPEDKASEGQVLVADGLGGTSWGTSSGSDFLKSQCVVFTNNPNHNGGNEPDYTHSNGAKYWRFSLINNIGKNVCEASTLGDNVGPGCSYTIWSTTNNIERQSLYGNTNWYHRQFPDGNWTDALGNNIGDNGDSVSKLFVNWSNVFYVYDDMSIGSYSENSPDEWTIRTDNDLVRTLTVCPAV